MCSELKLLDVIILQNKTFTNHAIVSSEDFQHCIIVEEGLYIFQLCGFMDNFLKTMSYTKWFIKINDYAISSHLGININSFIHSLPKYELYESVLRLELSEELSEATAVKQQPVHCQWSSLGLATNGTCVLGVMNQTGGLFLYRYIINEEEYEDFIEVANISKMCLNYLRKQFFPTPIQATPTNAYAELKRRVLIVTPTIFTWSHLIVDKNQTFSLLIVGHLDGGITICRINSINNNETRIECAVIGHYTSGLKRLTAAYWEKAGNNGLLIVGDIEGRSKAISVTNIKKDGVTFENQVFLWNHCDNLKVDHIEVLLWDNHLYVFLIKGNVLLICLIDTLGNILDAYAYRADNILITGVQHYEEDIILVLTSTGILKEIKLFHRNGKIQIEVRHLFTDFKWWAHTTHGLLISQNKVFLGTLISVSKLTNIKKYKDHTRLLIFTNTVKKPLEILFSGSRNSLTFYWDCFEVLRLNGLREKKLLTDKLPTELNYDKLSLVQVKMCFWLAKLSKMMDDKTRVFQENNVKFDNIKYVLKIKLAMEHTHFLLQLLMSNSSFSEFHIQSLDILIMFLKESISNEKIPKLGLGRGTIDRLYDIITVANELKYPKPPKCIWCEEMILGLSCVPPHPDMRCKISYMPISSTPYYKCQFCKTVVHEKLKEVYSTISCPFCDIPLKYVDTLYSNDMDDISEKTENDISNCSIDCLWDYNLSDLQKNVCTPEYDGFDVALSSCSSESDCKD